MKQAPVRETGELIMIGKKAKLFLGFSQIGYIVQRDDCANLISISIIHDLAVDPQGVLLFQLVNKDHLIIMQFSAHKCLDQRLICGRKWSGRIALVVINFRKAFKDFRIVFDTIEFPAGPVHQADPALFIAGNNAVLNMFQDGVLENLLFIELVLSML